MTKWEDLKKIKVAIDISKKDAGVVEEKLQAKLTAYRESQSVSVKTLFTIMEEKRIARHGISPPSSVGDFTLSDVIGLVDEAIKRESLCPNQ